jgi:hypothetical protein
MKSKLNANGDITDAATAEALARFTANFLKFEEAPAAQC